jgi:hypothetical protein
MGILSKPLATMMGRRVSIWVKKKDGGVKNGGGWLYQSDITVGSNSSGQWLLCMATYSKTDCDGLSPSVWLKPAVMECLQWTVFIYNG